MDWWQLLYSFIGGFLGFGFALSTEAIVNYLKNRNARIELHNNLMDELKSVAENLLCNENQKVHIYFEVPIWQSVTSTGILLSLLNANKKMYDEVILIYNRIYALKEMEKELDKNFNDISCIRQQIVNKIDNMVNVLRG